MKDHSVDKWKILGHFAAHSAVFYTLYATVPCSWMFQQYNFPSSSTLLPTPLEAQQPIGPVGQGLFILEDSPPPW